MLALVVAAMLALVVAAMLALVVAAMLALVVAAMLALVVAAMLALVVAASRALWQRLCVYSTSYLLAVLSLSNLQIGFPLPLPVVVANLPDPIVADRMDLFWCH